ncbi:MAG: hypothetical protein JNK77_01030 [Saprospiraceae bacterium]|nr:hypothetical protein [Saprospiraceae bacterium]
MKEVELLIPKALEAVQFFLTTAEGSQIVQKEYDGYAASLGAAIRTSGLIPALVFYSDVDKKENEPRRYKLLKAIAHTLGDVVNHHSNHDKRLLLERVLREAYGQEIFNRQVNRRNELQPINHEPDRIVIKSWTSKIVYASIALKLAMRNFKHSE